MQLVPDINWMLWISTMVPLTLSAGPGNIMVATSGARSGVYGSARFIAGLDVTYFILAIVIGWGLGALFLENPVFAQVVKVAGSLYVLFLSYQFFRKSEPGQDSDRRDFRFRDGIVIQLLNFKGMVMLLVMFTTFSPANNVTFDIVLLLSVALVSLNLFSHILWVTLGASLQRVLRMNPRLWQTQNIIFGAMLAAVSFWMLQRSI